MKILLYLITFALIIGFTLGLLIPGLEPLWWLSTIAMLSIRLIPRQYFE